MVILYLLLFAVVIVDVVVVESLAVSACIEKVSNPS